MLKDVQKLINEELIEFNTKLQENLKSNLAEFEPVLDYVFAAKGKQIRPTFGILAAKVLGEFNKNQSLFLQGIELIHQATLFHDDVIDNSSLRRGQKALQVEFNNKIAILTGDYFLSTALKNIYKINNHKINEKVANCMQKICEGELAQNFSLNQILQIGKYLEKTNAKTALLFELALEGVGILSENTTDEQIQALKNFGQNFGMAFQIKDDIKNFEKAEDKPVQNDLKEGVITAPIIFLAQEFPQVQELLEQQNYDEILDLLEKSNALEKTQKLAQGYIDEAKLALNNLPQNEYSSVLKKILTF